MSRGIRRTVLGLRIRLLFVGEFGGFLGVDVCVFESKEADGLSCYTCSSPVSQAARFVNFSTSCHAVSLFFEF